MEITQNVCRVCLRLNANVNLFNEDTSEPYCKLVVKLTVCTQIEILENDFLTKFVCLVCADKIVEAFAFRESAQHADRELKRRLELVGNESHASKCVNMEAEMQKDSWIVNKDKNYIGKRREIKMKGYHTNKIKTKNVDTKEKFIVNHNHLSDPILLNSRELLNHLDNSEFSSHYYDQKECVQRITDNEKSNINTVENLIKEALNCTLCNIIFKHKKTFRRHMRIEHNLKGVGRAKDYMCDTCGKSFHDQYGLQMHKRSHTGDRPFTCSVCGQGFTQQSNMERHVFAKHNKVKPYQCEVCSKEFAYSSSLREHKQRHSGEKKYQCSVCDRMFSRNYTLIRHRLTHTQARPYVCKYCSRSYTQSNDLKIHVKKTHPERSVEKFSDYCTKQLK